MKYFQKLIDFRGNRAKNLKADIPLHEDDIVPKKYVQQQTFYNTVKSILYKNPFKFPWIKNAYEKPVTEILDDLLYPRVLPEYKNPTLVVHQQYGYNNDFEIAGPPLILNPYRTRPVGFEYNITQNDRTLRSAVRLTITYNDGTPPVIFTDIQIRYSGVFNVTTTTHNIESVVIRAQFNATSEVYLDSYGNQYVDPAFQSVFDIERPIEDQPEELISQSLVTYVWLSLFNSEVFIDNVYNNADNASNFVNLINLGLTPAHTISTATVAPDTNGYRKGMLLFAFEKSMINLDVTIHDNLSNNTFSIQELLASSVKNKILADNSIILAQIPYTIKNNQLSLIIK